MAAKKKAEENQEQRTGVYTLRALDKDLKPMDIGGVETEIRSIDEVLVVRCRGRIDQEMVARLHEGIAERFPGRTVIVADEAFSGFFELVAVAPAEETASPDV